MRNWTTCEVCSVTPNRTASPLPSFTAFCLQRLKAHCEQQTGGQQSDGGSAMRAATTVVEGAPILTPDQGFTAPRADHSETGDFLLTFFWFMKKKNTCSR